MDKLEQEILFYQRGDITAGQYIYEQYKDFVFSYASLLKYGDLDITNVMMRNFIGLFMRSSVSRYLHTYMYRPSLKQAIYNRINDLTVLFESFSYEDIVNEAVIVLFELALKYIPSTNSSFHMYISRVFNIYFKRHLEKLLKDPLLSIDWIELKDARFIQEEDEEEGIEDIMEDDESSYDINWLQGLTATGAFEHLTYRERKILVLYYIDGLRDTQIAQILGYQSRETINRYRLKAKERVLRYVKDNNLYGLRHRDSVYNKETAALHNMCQENGVQPEQDTTLQIKTGVHCSRLA